MKPLMKSLILTMIAISASAQYVPKKGFVPDAETAVKIAEAVLIPVYSKKTIESERPFTATLEGNVWHVYGTLRCSDGKGRFAPSSECKGGVAEVKIAKTNGQVISMIHGK